MFIVKLFEFNSIKIRILHINSISWFVASDVFKAIEVSKAATDLESLISINLGKEHCQKYPILTSGGVQKLLIISEIGLKYFLQRSRKSGAKLLASKLNLDLNIMQSPVEAVTLKIISSAFQHLKPLEQFFVSGFRIDLYFPEQRLAVECMENAHKYKVLKDQKREQDISQILNCNWIYYYPQHKTFNIGNTLNEIIQYIYKN